MSYELIVKPAAENDLWAYSWYEGKQLGLGTLFLESVEPVFEKVLEYPEIYQEVDEGIRRGVIRTFPYCVFYTIDESELQSFGLRNWWT